MQRTAGYTNHWVYLATAENPDGGFSDAQWEILLRRTKAIIADAAAEGIVIAGPTGTGRPIVDGDAITLNGDASTRNALEAFHLPRVPSEEDRRFHQQFLQTFPQGSRGGAVEVARGFCKTNGKPYDAVVASILAEANRVGRGVFEASTDAGAVRRVFAREGDLAACWDGYEAVGMKEKDGRQVPNCVPTKTAADRSMYNPHAEGMTFDEFRRQYFRDPNIPVPHGTARSFWDDFRFAYIGPLWKYIKETTDVEYMMNQRMAARYSRDPYWITAKYPGVDRNGRPFKKGERVFYYPIDRTIISGPEAQAAAEDFEAAAFDEDFGYRAAGDTFRPGDAAMWNGRRVLVLDTHGFPVKTVDVRWTESGVPGSRDEVANTKRNVPVGQLTRVAYGPPSHAASASKYPSVARQVEDDYRRKAITSGERRELLDAIENAGSRQDAERIVEQARKGRTASTRVAYEPPFHNAAKADEALGEAYWSLIDLKLGFDSWNEIPQSAMPLYREILKAVDAIVGARRVTTQVRAMVARKRY